MGSFAVAGLFAGIGGIELGLDRAGHRTELLCEAWEPAASVLAERFPGVPVHPDVRTLRSLPRSVDLLTAGFPCQDLSQAGMAAGIGGSQSGLVDHVFRLIGRRHPRWLLLENVQFMLQLDRGRAMSFLVAELSDLGYRWAYRVVDSRFTGVPQRRRRVLLLASRAEDPRAVLFADDAGERPESDYRSDAFGFYWTEGLKGLGWARDAVPTLKGGSTVGIPSSPGIWVPDAEPGQKLIMPSIEDTEVLQGFPRGWTQPADLGRRNGPRWKLTGNAVTVGVARWLGERLSSPGSPSGTSLRREEGAPWPSAAWGDRSGVFRVDVSEYPRHESYVHLRDVVDETAARPITNRGARGFYGRTLSAKLRFDPKFIADVVQHIEVTGSVESVPA
ncbi:MAG: DNA cytosine methyltransferase [Acidimicrobiales bacterium]